MTVTGTIAPAATGTLTNTVTVLPGAGVVDLELADNTAIDETLLQPIADLALAKTHIGNFDAGGAGQFMLTVSNAGPSLAQSVEVIDTLPAGLLFTGAGGDGWSCGEAPVGTVTCDHPGPVPAGGQLPELLIDVDVELTAASELINTATLSSSTPDPQQANNVASDSVRIVRPLLELKKTDVLWVDGNGDSLASEGDVLRYQLTLSNLGDGAAYGVRLVDAIPPQTSLVPGSLSLSTGQVLAENPIDIAIDILAAGDTATVVFDARLADNLAGITEVSNQATVSALGVPNVASDDPETVESGDPTVTAVFGGEPEFTLSKVDALYDDVGGDGVPSPGDVVEYVITLSNIGEGAATQVVLRDAIPQLTSLDPTSVTTDSGTVVSEQPLEVDLGVMLAGATATVRFRVVIDAAFPRMVGEIVNQARLTSAELPEQLSDDPDTPAVADATRTEVADPGQSTYCDEDSFGLLDAEWNLAFLGDADAGQAESVDGRLQLTGNGSTLYRGPDSGAFLHRATSSDFRAEVDLVDVIQDVGGTYRKACLMVRSSLAADAARSMVCFVPGHPTGPALYFDVRQEDGGAGAVQASTEVNIALPVRVALVRRGDVVTVSYVDADGEWTEPLGALRNSVPVALGEQPLVGLIAASYGVEPSFGLSFDDWRLCRPADGGGDPGTPPACDPEKPLDIFYLLDLSQSMDSAFPGAEAGSDPSKLGAAKLALERLHRQIELRGDGSRAALVTFYGASDVATNLAGAVQIRAPLTGDLASVADEIASLDALARPGLTTTPTALALEEVVDLLAGSLTTPLEPERQAAVAFVTDGVPNIDRDGRGHHHYLMREVQAIDIRDDSGAFLPWPVVAWQGAYNRAYGTFDGETLGNAMYELDRLSEALPELAFYGLGIRGDGEGLGSFHLDLVDYAAWTTGGLSFAPASHGAMEQAVDDMLFDLQCGLPGAANLGDRVWNDLDGDGVEEIGEPGVAGVTVEAFAGASFIASAVTGASGSYRLGDLPPGSLTVRLDPATLPAGLRQASFDVDGALTPHVAVLEVAAFEVRDDIDFGVRAAVSSAPPAAQATACELDPFDDPDGDGLPAASWQLTGLGDADMGSAVVGDGVLELSSNGPSLWSEDHSHFLHRGVPEGDFRFEVDVLDFPLDPGGSRFRKAGLMARRGLGVEPPRVMTQVVPDYENPEGPAMLFGLRKQEGGPATALSIEVTDVALPMRLALERRGSTYGALYSLDGGLTWQRETRGSQGGFAELDLGGELGDEARLGLSVASYDLLAPMTAAFDNAALCAPRSVAPWSPSISSCDPALPMDVVVVVDGSGSMSTAFAGALNRLAAAGDTVGQLMASLAARSDGSRAALILDTGQAAVLTGLTAPADVADLAGQLSAPDAASGSAPAAYLWHAIDLLAAESGAGRRPVVLWLSDGEATIDLDGRTYAEELSALDLQILEPSGDFLPWPQVAWLGPFSGPWSTFAGQPWAETMVTVDQGRLLVPDLEIHTLTLQGDGLVAPTLALHLPAFAAWLTSGSDHVASDAGALLGEADALWDHLVCQTP